MTERLTEEEIAEMWDRWDRGESARSIARQFSRGASSIVGRIRDAGGIRPTIPHRAERHLTFEEREEISRGLAANCSLREIARRLGRSPSTVSREVNNNGGPKHYRATNADKAAEKRRRRPKVCKLAASPRLRGLVRDKLGERWSPEQIAGWLKREHPGDQEMWVSHETSTEPCSSSPVARSNAS